MLFQNRNLKMNHIVLIFLVCAIFCALNKAEAKDISPEIKYISSGIEDARGKIQDVRVKMQVTELFPKEFNAKLKKSSPQLKDLEEGDRIEATTVVWSKGKNSRKIYIDFENSKINDPVKSDLLVVHNETAKNVTMYFDPKRTPKPYHFGSISDSKTTLKADLWSKWPYMTPWSDVYYAGTEPLDIFFLKPEVNATYLGMKDFGKDSCMVVETTEEHNYKSRFWIDANHGFLLRKRLDYLIANGKELVLRETKVNQLLQVGELFSPAIVEWKEYLIPTLVEMTTDRSVKANIKKFTFSEFGTLQSGDEEAFLEWPLGTNFTDNRTKVRWVVVPVEPSEIGDLKTLMKTKKDSDIQINEDEKVDLDSVKKFNKNRAQDEPEKIGVVMSSAAWSALRTLRDERKASKEKPKQ